jgi:hypothetical protein
MPVATRSFCGRANRWRGHGPVRPSNVPFCGRGRRRTVIKAVPEWRGGSPIASGGANEARELSCGEDAVLRHRNGSRDCRCPPAHAANPRPEGGARAHGRDGNDRQPGGRAGGLCPERRRLPAGNSQAGQGDRDRPQLSRPCGRARQRAAPPSGDLHPLAGLAGRASGAAFVPAGVGPLRLRGRVGGDHRPSGAEGGARACA